MADGDIVIVLQFSTVNFEFARQFSELFEGIADTLRLFYPDEPTFRDQDERGLDEDPESAGRTAE